MDKNDANKTEQTTNALPKLTLKKESIRVLGVRTGVQTGLIISCPASCVLVTQFCPFTKK